MQSFEEFVSLTQRASRADEVEALFRKQISEMGYENYVFATIIDRRMASVQWCQLPDGYAADYLSNRWDRVDPIFKRSLIAGTPFHWSDVVRNETLSRRESHFLNTCREIGVHSGVSIPVHGPGQRLDLISLSLRENELPDPNWKPLLHAMTVQAVTRYAALCAPIKKRAEPQAQLTRRELEILKWLKEGKTIAEISIILGISNKTIEYHVTNLYRKLGTYNRTGAVVVGIQQGLIPV